MTENKEASQKRAFMLLKTFIKDISFESPHAPMIFPKIKQSPLPPPELNINCGGRSAGNDLFEYVLKLEATAKLDNDVAYLAEIEQVGLFRIVGYSENEMKSVLFRDRCPRELFPFARESLTSLIEKGGFGQELIGSINFSALFDNQQIEMDKQAQSLVDEQLGI